MKGSRVQVPDSAQRNIEQTSYHPKGGFAFFKFTQACLMENLRKVKQGIYAAIWSEDTPLAHGHSRKLHVNKNFRKFRIQLRGTSKRQITTQGWFCFFLKFFLHLRTNSSFPMKKTLIIAHVLIMFSGSAEALKYPNRFYARSNMASFNWTRNDMSLWCPLVEEGKATKHPKYDPCPEGWRVPELFDFYSLAEHYSDFVEYPEGGPKGRWFSGPAEYSTNVQRIFLPATGMRTRDGESHSRDRQAIYWSLRHGGGEGLVWHLYLNDYEAVVNPSAFPHEAYSVRCVKDIEGQGLR